MANDNLSLLEIQDLIIKFNLDESINDLKKYYATPTTWEIIKQSRRETSHTQFLAWLFDNKDFNADPNSGPIKKLIVLLLKWANRQKCAFFDEELAESIYSQNLSIISYKVKPEFPIFIGSNISDVADDSNESNKPSYGEGSIDIFITVIAEINSTVRTIHIAIENKIDAPETKKCFDDKGKLLKKPKKTDNITTIFQTEAYFQYVTEVLSNEEDINLFVYLKPTDCSLDNIKEAECAVKGYIQINYQELLDYIIQPIYEQEDISSENVFRLKDYIKTLGKPSETDDENVDNSNKKITIMAMEQRERDLLTKFFENNETLIRAAVNALGDEDLSASMAKVPSKQSRVYSINNSQTHYTMYEVLEQFIKYRIGEKNVTIKEINDEINGYIYKRNGNRVNLSDDPDTEVYRESLHYGEFEVGGLCIRYTKEWGDNGGNFTSLRTSINEKYTDFQINAI